MKFKLIVFLVALSLLKLKAQLVSIDNATISVAPSYTLNNGDSFTVTGSVKNAGATTLVGNVHVHFAIDTSSTVGVNKFLTRVSNTYPQSNFLPNTSFTFSLGDNADQGNNYKVAGNGITVVVWASYGPNPLDASYTKDSVLSHIYVLPPLQSIADEKAFEENAITIQNPANAVILFEVSSSEFEVSSCELLNSKGELIIKESPETEQSNLTLWNSSKQETFTLETNNLSNGMYYLRFTNKKTNKTLIKKIIILN